MSFIVAPPKLPPHLPIQPAPRLEPAISLEAIECHQVDWSSQQSKRADFDVVRFVEPNWTSTKLPGSGWTDVQIQGGTLAGADLTTSGLRRVQLSRIRANGLVLAETRARDLTVTDAKLDLANFRFAQWERVNFVNCSLREADFMSAQFKNITFDRCELVSCDFSGAKFNQVDLTGSRIESPKGILGLKGATIGYDQLISLAPELAQALEIIVK